MSWDLTFLFVHLTAAFVFAKLFTRACWSQKFICMGMLISMLTLAAGFAMKINSVDGYIYVFWLAFANTDVAVLFYCFRLVYKEYLCLPTGLKRSLN